MLYKLLLTLDSFVIELLLHVAAKINQTQVLDMGHFEPIDSFLD
jgi:hypothetical protein